MTNIRRNPGGTPFRYGGWDFSEAEIDRIRQITDDPWCTTRQAIARAVCTALDWTMSNGQPKIGTCRKALQAMEADGVIWLPLPTIAAPASHPRDCTDSSAPQAPVTGSWGGALWKVGVI